MAREYKDVWNEPAEVRSLNTPLSDEDKAEEEYLDRERHDHGLELWTLANIFEPRPLEPGEDTHYRDFHLAIVDQWKVVTLEIGRWSGTGPLAVDIDLFAVRR